MYTCICKLLCISIHHSFRFWHGRRQQRRLQQWHTPAFLLMLPILIPLPPSPLFQRTGECLKGPVSTAEDHVLKRPLGRSLHLFASTAYSLCSLHGSIHGLAFFFPSWDWKLHDSRYTGMIAIVKPVGCDLQCMAEFFLCGRDHREGHLGASHNKSWLFPLTLFT